jgi:hypothetical protein
VGTTIRSGLTFGAAIATANLILQFVGTPYVAWQIIAVLSVGTWLGGVIGAGAWAGRTGSLRSAASAAVIAAVVDVVRAAIVTLAVGTPPAPSSSGLGAPTPGLVIAGTMLELLLLAPVAAGIGLAAARLSRRPLSSS